MKILEVDLNCHPKTFLSKSSLETASNVSSQVPINQPQQQAQQQPQQPQQQTTTPNKPVKIHVIKTHTPPKQVNLIQRSTAIQKPKLPLTTSTASTTTSASTRTPSIAARSTSVRRQKLLENSPLKKDVSTWTLNDVCKWIVKTCGEYELPRPYPVDRFIMNGKALLLLSKLDFVNRSRFCGDVLYYALVNFTSETKPQQPELQLVAKNASKSILNPVVASSSSSSPTAPTKLTQSLAEYNKYNNYYQMFNETTNSIYNVDGFIQDLDRSENNEDGLYDYLKYLNDISFSSGVSATQKGTSPPSPTHSQSPPPPPYQSIQFSTKYLSSSSSSSPTSVVSAVASSSSAVATTAAASSTAADKINFNYTNNQVHYHIYDMNYFNDVTPSTTTTTTTKTTSNTPLLFDSSRQVK